VYFASELRAFGEIPGLDLSLDASATGDYLRFGYVPDQATIYSKIGRVAPATLVEFDLDGIVQPTERSYWQIPQFAPASKSMVGDRSEELLHLLSASVRNRLVSDRPVGAFLSGGIDSSLVCALAAQHTTGALKTFTMGWEDAEYDESRQAATVAAALGADHHDVRLGRAEVVSAVERLGAVMDEPFGDSSQLAVLLVASQAREHVVVALSGDGGDELFAGYNRHRWLLTSRSVRKRVPKWVRHPGARLGHRAAPMVELALRRLPPTRRPRLIADKVRKLASMVESDSLAEAYQRLLAHDFEQGTGRNLTQDVKAALSAGQRDGVLWALRSADLTGYLPDDLLTKVDRATMSVSLESRTPFLHPDLVEAAFGLGAEQLIGRSGGKQPLRRLLGALLPTVSFDQRKFGFGVPVASLLRTELRSKLSDAVCTHVARRPPPGPQWSDLCARLNEGDDSAAPMLWSLLMFEQWAEEVPHAISWK
jgi:asparagine synthase (glutamine-hydrolysing)